jgi:SHS2 domain-containing protein
LLINSGPLAQLVEQDPLKVKVRSSILRRLIFYTPLKVAEKFYEILEHTADIRMRVKAGDLKTLFSRCALAMFDIIAGQNKIPADGAEELIIVQESGSLEELFINWLNELLSLSSAQGLVFLDFKIKKLSENALEARVSGVKSVNFKIEKEIKAATYHQLQISKSGGGWKAEVIFDV